jgi:hypothetical protein
MLKRSLAALSLLLLTTACFEIDQKITLEKDLSGTAALHVDVDFEPMIRAVAQFTREMQGEEGAVTEADLAKARAEFKSKSGEKSDPAAERAELEKNLPEGVKLLDQKVVERDFGVSTDVRFAFDRLSRLVGVKLSGGGSDPAAAPADSPFANLEIEEKGDLITIRSKPENPADKVKQEAAEQMPVDAEMEALMAESLKKMRVSYSITTPFEIVSHNATRKEGKTLIWVFDKDALEKAKSSDDVAVKVTYRR